MATRIIIEANPRPNSIRTQVARQRAKMQRVAWAAVDLLDEALEPYSDAKATVNKLDHSFLSVRTAARDDVDHYVIYFQVMRMDDDSGTMSINIIAMGGVGKGPHIVRNLADMEESTLMKELQSGIIDQAILQSTISGDWE